MKVENARTFIWLVLGKTSNNFTSHLRLCLFIYVPVNIWYAWMKNNNNNSRKIDEAKVKMNLFFFVPSRLSLYFMFYINHYIPLILFYYLLQIFVKKCKKEYFLSIAFVIFLCVNWSNFASFAFLGRILFVTVFCYLFNDFNCRMYLQKEWKLPLELTMNDIKPLSIYTVNNEKQKKNFFILLINFFGRIKSENYIDFWHF